MLNDLRVENLVLDRRLDGVEFDHDPGLNEVPDLFAGEAQDINTSAGDRFGNPLCHQSVQRRNHRCAADA